MNNAIGRVMLALIAFSGLALAQVVPSVVADEVLYAQPTYYNHASHIARSTNDDLIAVWTDTDDGEIVFSKYDDAFATWSAPVAVSNAGDQAHKAGIAADGSGNLFMVWQQRDSVAQDWRIFFSKYAGVSWSDPVDISGDSTENEEACIAVDDAGVIHVAWNTDAESDGAEFILSKRSSDGGDTWTTPPDTLNARDGVIGGTSTTSGRPFLAAGNGGKMVAAWHEELDDHAERVSMSNQYDGTAWGDEMYVADSTDTDPEWYPTIGVDSEDNIICIYTPQGHPMLMKKKTWDATAWPVAADTILPVSYALLDSAEFYPYKPFLVIHNDDLYVGFRNDMQADTTYDLEEVSYVASTDDGATWTDPVRLSREGYDAGYITMFTPRTLDSGIDILWRESSHLTQDDDDTTAVVYAHLDVLTPFSIRDNAPVAKSFKLHQNYPNPFNPSTNIFYSIQSGGEYELAIFNLLGQRVRTLVSTALVAGDYTITWDGTNDLGQHVSSGVYFYRLSGAGASMVHKMILMR